MSLQRGWISLVLILAVCTPGWGSVIHLPQEELAKESVLPVFNRPVSVKNRKVVTDGRVDIGLGYGLALSEPIYDVSRYGLSMYYHTSENHGFGLVFTKSSNSVSTYAKQLREKYNLDFTRAPSPDQTYLLDWNWKMFYGKMSVTKLSNLNFHLYTTFAGGMTKFVHKSYPTVAAGVGQKFYFGSSFALRFDLRLFMNQAPIPFKVGAIQVTDPVPTYESFAERMTYTTVLDAGISWLF